MDDEPLELNIGLAEEERKDLENLIGVFKDDRFLSPQDAAPEELQKQVAFMKEKVTRMSVMLLDLDKKMRSLHKLIRLFHSKTEMMNERINHVVELVKTGKPR